MCSEYWLQDEKDEQFRAGKDSLVCVVGLLL